MDNMRAVRAAGGFERLKENPDVLFAVMQASGWQMGRGEMGCRRVSVRERTETVCAKRKVSVCYQVAIEITTPSPPLQ